jgi:hypothetical protein
VDAGADLAPVLASVTAGASGGGHGMLRAPAFSWTRKWNCACLLVDLGRSKPPLVQ